MKIYGVKTPIIKTNDDLVQVFLEGMKNFEGEKKNIQNLENSIITITSKIISVVEGSIRKYSSEKELFTIIKKEADRILGGSKKYNFWLTEKQGIICPNSGIDTSNAELKTAILYPKNAQKSADKFCKKIKEKFGLQNLGVIICDSRVIPFRKGISGVALAWSGFEGISDERGKKDLYGKPLEVSEIAVADNLSSVAQNFMGQSAESTPFVVFKKANVRFTNEKQDSKKARIGIEEDLYSEIFKMR